MYVLKTPEGKTVRVSLRDDTRMYKSPRNPPNTGTRFTQGEDLYAHKARSGTNYFYIAAWSMWQGATDTVELVTEQEARDFLILHAGKDGHEALDTDEEQLAETYFPDIFDETG